LCESVTFRPLSAASPPRVGRLCAAFLVGERQRAKAPKKEFFVGEAREIFLAKKSHGLKAGAGATKVFCLGRSWVTDHAWMRRVKSGAQADSPCRHRKA